MNHAQIEAPTINRDADARQRAWEDVCHSLDWARITQDIICRFGAALQTHGNPISEVLGALQDAPIEDFEELDGFCRYTRLCQAEALGRHVLRLIGTAQVEHLQANRPF